MAKLDTKLVYETPLFVGQGTRLLTTIWMIDSIEVYILCPLSTIERVTSYKEAHVLNY